jgi:hypothetical protein
MLTETKVKGIIKAFTEADQIGVVFYTESAILEQAGPLSNDPNGQVLMLRTPLSDDDEGFENYIIFTEQGLSDAHVEGNSITLADVNGEQYTIRLWKHTELNVVDFL